MRRMVIIAVGACALLALASLAAPTGATAASSPTPRWVLHVQKYPGSISGGAQAMISPEVVAARAVTRTPATFPSLSFGPNVQMNHRDSNPPLPQNETAVAASLDDPNVAVAAANDYVNGGNVVMRTKDGGRTWQTNYVVPRFGGSFDVCTGGDPSVAYSRRDHVFYMSQLCFFRTLPYSEVQVYVSRDNGFTWTPGEEAARAATNFNYTKGTVDASVFNDKEYLAVDNSPSSPHYGRLYVTYTKFHIMASGFSDYCPIELSYTDKVDLTVPANTAFNHTKVQPDNPGGNGVDRSANQFSVPVVEPNGTLDISFVQEECNTSIDRHLLFQRSRDGGRTFLPAVVQVDKRGQYRDFHDKGQNDTLPPTNFRAPNTESMTYNSGVLTYLYQNNINRPQSKADISYQQSRDGGLHWSDMKFLSTDGGGRPARNDQFFPWVTSGGNGTLFAIWFDRRLDPNNVNIDTWQAASYDNGRTWSQRRISTKSWNPNHAFFTSGAFIGDYNGIDASRTHVYPVWTDGRNSAWARTGIGETDIFTDVETR